MDRLICGDVGFGKTEVAMRAAFKAVDSGYQVAVLVPTTILAEQHLPHVHASGWPSSRSTIESAQPLLHAAEEKRDPGRRWPTARSTSSSARTGWCSHDVEFQNLGLVIIDEEQRFGVEVKERLKALRQHGRCADADGHADPAHAAHVAARPARHLEPGDAAAKTAWRSRRASRASTTS